MSKIIEANYIILLKQDQKKGMLSLTFSNKNERDTFVSTHPEIILGWRESMPPQKIALDVMADLKCETVAYIEMPLEYRKDKISKEERRTVEAILRKQFHFNHKIPTYHFCSEKILTLINQIKTRNFTETKILLERLEPEEKNKLLQQRLFSENTALEYAILQGNVDLITLLIEHGANFEGMDTFSSSVNQKESFYHAIARLVDFPEIQSEIAADASHQPEVFQKILAASLQLGPYQKKDRQIILDNLLAGKYCIKKSSPWLRLIKNVLFNNEEIQFKNVKLAPSQLSQDEQYDTWALIALYALELENPLIYNRYTEKLSALGNGMKNIFDASSREALISQLQRELLKLQYNNNPLTKVSTQSDSTAITTNLSNRDFFQLCQNIRKQQEKNNKHLFSMLKISQKHLFGILGITLAASTGLGMSLLGYAFAKIVLGSLLAFSTTYSLSLIVRWANNPFAVKSKASEPNNIESTQEPIPDILRLPEEIVLNIMQYLSASDLGRMAQVCKALQPISEDDLLWKNLTLGLGLPLNAKPYLTQNWGLHEGARWDDSAEVKSRREQNWDLNKISAKRSYQNLAHESHFLERAYDKEILKIFGDKKNLLAIPILTLDNECKESGPHSITPDQLKGNKIMRGKGGCWSEDNSPSHFISFCLKKSKEIEVANGDKEIKQHLYVQTLYFNGWGLLLTDGISIDNFYVDEKMIGYLTRLVRGEPCGKLCDFAFGIGQEEGPRTTQSGQSITQLSDQSEFDMEIKKNGTKLG